MSEPAALAAAVEAAQRRLADRVIHTPLVPAAWLERELAAEVRLKLENVQLTGSFKLRGASNAVAQLTAAQRQRGVVAASSGNHGLGVALAARTAGVAATVFVPSTTPAAKRQAIGGYGAAVEIVGDDCLVTERHARDVAARTGRVYLSPYNDADVVAGQGTIAVELLADWPSVEVVYVAVGGGGLVGGMAAWLKARHPAVEVVGCSPAASPAMATCVRRGEIVDVACQPTWSDSTAGGVEADALTFPLCRDLVDRFVDVDEAAIERALRDCLIEQHLLIEGAAGVAIAAARADSALRARRAAVIVCGGNLPFAWLQRLVTGAATGSASLGRP